MAWEDGWRIVRHPRDRGERRVALLFWFVIVWCPIAALAGAVWRLLELVGAPVPPTK